MEEEYYNRLGEILEKIHPNVTIANAEGVFIYASQQSCEYFLVKSTDLIGKSINNPEIKEIFTPCVTEMVFRQRKKISTIQKNSVGKETLVTGIPIFNKDNNLDIIISFSSWDVTSYENLQSSYELIKKDKQSLIEEINRLTLEKNIYNNVISKSKKSLNVVKLLNTFSMQNIPTFLYGPEGSGKTYYAKCAYEKKGLIYEYNCNLMVEEGMSCDLFGDDNGKTGILMLNNYNVFMIHNIEELSPVLQRKLVGIIKNYKKIVIGTSTHSLDDLKKDNKITEELYYLFKGYQVQIISINERPEDLQEFISHYIKFYNSKYDKNITFTAKAINCLLNYEWTQNITEVKYTIERIILTADSDIIDIYDLPEQMTSESFVLYQENCTLKDMLEIYEKGIIQRAYDDYKTTVEVAKRLGISQASAVRKINKYAKITENN